LQYTANFTFVECLFYRASEPKSPKMSDALEQASPAVLGTLLHLQQRALGAVTPADLGFILVNETLSLVPFRQAAFFTVSPGGKPKLTTASGLVSVAEDSPFAVWLGRFASSLPIPSPCANTCQRLDISQAKPEFNEGWQEWLPEHLVTARLMSPSARPVGLLIYARDTPWADEELALLNRVHESYGYCLDALGKSGRSLLGTVGNFFRHGAVKWFALAAVLALFIPVRLSALAPAEVIALSAMAVAAPQDGVISAFHASPNSPVRVGDKLFSLDDSALTSRREVARRAVAIAKADLLVAQQRAFDDVKSKGELAASAGRVREKESELALAEGTLDRVVVKAERDGLAIYGDPNDWLGRPVQTGERVMQLADPKDAGVLIWLPVADALNLELGAPIRLFLSTAPLDPLGAKLVQTSYQAVMSPDGVSAYRLRGVFDEDSGKARIGLRGTARVSGEWATLGYYLFRRPLSALREWTGL
jgi:hypothetical protein